MQLVRWQIFNVICGNSDGHAKNIALLQDERGRWRLAPAYDLVSTQTLKVYNPELGFAVGDNYMPGAISKKDWHGMAGECGITKRKSSMMSGRHWLSSESCIIQRHCC
jgi:serine/threonine-protein kinase HipA